jgi:DNA-binding transcriptional LysR family regulator
MEIRHLRYFIAVAEELHFGRAAERLHITQPVLSQQIQVLEAELGLELFSRTKRRVQLTQAGQVLLEQTRQVLDCLEQAIQLTQRTARGEVGKLTISYTRSALHRILAKVVRVFRDRYPNVELNLIQSFTETQVEVLRTGQVDLGFLHPPIRDDSLMLEHLFDESFLVALPLDHPLLQYKAIPLHALATETIILPPRHEAPVLYDQFMNLCLQAEFHPKIQTATGGVDLVTAGMGVTFVPESFLYFSVSGVDCRPLVTS